MNGESDYDESAECKEPYAFHFVTSNMETIKRVLADLSQVGGEPEIILKRDDADGAPYVVLTGTQAGALLKDSFNDKYGTSLHFSDKAEAVNG